jgi:hypothetical protein
MKILSAIGWLNLNLLFPSVMIWTILHLFLECHKNVIQLKQFRDLHLVPVILPFYSVL